MDKVRIVTVATHMEGSLKQLVNNKYNIKIKLLAFGKKWTGFKMKLEEILNYIKDLPDDYIIVFLDGFDSKINKPINNLLKFFKNYKCKILFSEHIFAK